MSRFGKNILLLCCILLALTVMTGCRTRTSGLRPEESPAVDNGTAARELSGESEVWQAETDRKALPGEDGNKTADSPEASRKEFDENAAVEIVPGTERALNAEGEGEGKAQSDDEAGEKASRLNDEAEERAAQTVPAEEAEQMGVSEDADEAKSYYTYYTALLQDRMSSLFECQRLSVYWETAEDHLTVHKTSPEHELILNAGAYDVSARLLSENLRVDDGWIARKNPGVIVKAVDSSILGSGVFSLDAARAEYRKILARSGFDKIDAVKSERVLLISEQLLEEPYLQTVVMLLIAKTANREVMADVSPSEALKALMEEATGSAAGGVYYYTAKEE